jgi:hypothetical protein
VENIPEWSRARLVRYRIRVGMPSCSRSFLSIPPYMVSNSRVSFSHFQVWSHFQIRDERIKTLEKEFQQHSRYTDWLRAERSSSRSSSPDRVKDFLFTSSRLPPESIQPPIQ